MSERRASPGAPTSPLRVIIVDDAEETRKSIQMMMSLVPNGEVVAVGVDGREAITLARRHRPHIALIDINMPNVDGLTAIEVIRREQPEIICIVISAEKDPPTLQRAIAVGAHGYLIKPVTAEQLMSVMERASKVMLATRPPVRPHTPVPPPNLEALAAEYAQKRRADNEALRVFETLAQQPDCKLRWLMTLAMLYVVRQEWAKLKALAARLEGAR